MRTPIVIFVSVGLALFLCCILAFFACSFGMLLSGIEAIFAVFVSTVLCVVAISIISIIFKRKGKHFTWRSLFVTVAILSTIICGLQFWTQTRHDLKIFFEPSPLPAGLHVYRGRTILFSSYVHFTAPPSAIAAIVQSKGLIEVPAEIPDEGTNDLSGFSARENTKKSWGWWQPTNMPNSKLFFRHHESEAVQGWTEGWWINGATNEVYAFISG